MSLPSLLAPAPDANSVSRVALVSVHTSPLAQPGTGDGGGLNVYVRETARRLAARGVEVDIFTRWSDPELPGIVDLADGVRVHHIAAGPRTAMDKSQVANHLCAFVLALQDHPTAGSHDVIHGHYWLSGWVGRRLAHRWGSPMVQTFHTLGVMKNASLAPGDTPETPLRLAAERRVAADAGRLLVLTCGEARLMHRTYGVSGERLTVVPAGVDLERFHPSATARVASPDPHLLFVGRMQPLKGPDVAIRTLAAVRRERPTARLTMIGGVSGNGEGLTSPTQLRQLAQELGVAHAVTIEPAVAQRELAHRYREADVVLVPSRSETFGLVALEAQACGVPVVAAAVPGLEAVVSSGGTLVKGHDPADHAAAVLRYLNDPEVASRALAAGVELGKRSSWERTVDRLMTVYAEVVRSGQLEAV